MEITLISLATFILGVIAGVYLPNKFRKEDKMPRISIGPFQQRQNYFDITNHGGDILNLKIEIYWLQGGTKKNREMNNFYNTSEDPAFGSAHNCNSLKKGETKKVVDCPAYSDNGEIEVIVTGADVSGKAYKGEFILKNGIKSDV